MAQAEIAAAEAYPMRAIQSSLDFHLRTAKTRTTFFAWHAPVISIPADGVIVGYRAAHAYAEDFFQPLLWGSNRRCALRGLRGATLKRPSHCGIKRVSKK